MSSRKRKGNFNNNQHIYSNSKWKKRKTVHTKEKQIYSKYWQSKFFTTKYDQIQFKRLFKLINSSQLFRNHGIPECLAKEIAEFGNGQWVKCHNTECRTKISFLAEDINEILPLQCIECNQKGYYQWCNLHNQAFTIPKSSNQKCQDCLTVVCYNGMKRCPKCNSWICENCALSDGECIGCWEWI